MSNFESFSKLKKDLLFHERRMQLLLATRIVEDLGSNLHEKQLSREECAADCKQSIEKFEVGAAEGRLTGRWDELKVSSLFGLEVPLNVVIGSGKFEKPPEDNGGVRELIERMQSISTRFPEFAPHDDGGESLAEFHNLMGDAQWTPRDINRIKEAIQAKLSVLTELDNLSNALQDSTYGISCQQTRLEELRRAEETADEDGEMSLADSILQEKMASLEKMLDLHFFQIHTVEASIDSNVTRRKSNLTVFQGGAAMIECIKQEKQSMVDGCKKDLARIDRGLQYEDKATGDNRKKAKDALAASLGKIHDLDARQQELAIRLKELYQDFAETEQALEQVGVERAKAVESHVELVESSRHATSDFLEMSKFAQVYQDNLQRTKEEYAKGIVALDSLEKLLLQQQSFDSYDFNASARRLRTMQRRVSLDLNRALNEYETLGEDALRRYEARIAKLDDQIDNQSCEVELRKELFDPSTKKYVMNVNSLHEQRNKLMSEMTSLKNSIDKQRNTCLEKVKQHLNSEEIVDVSDINATRTMRRKEELLDMRQQNLAPEDSQIVTERQTLARVRQSLAASNTSTSQGPGGAPRKTTASRVAALRNDVEVARAATPPAPAIEAPPQVDDNVPEAAGQDSTLPPDVSGIAPEDISINASAMGEGGFPSKEPAADASTAKSKAEILDASRLEAIKANAAAIEARTMAYRKKARTIGAPSAANLD